MTQNVCQQSAVAIQQTEIKICCIQNYTRFIRNYKDEFSTISDFKILDLMAPAFIDSLV